MDREALNDVSYQIDEATEAVRTVLGLLDDCGLVKYDYKLVKDGMLHCLQIFDIAFDVVDLAKDERVKS